MNAKLKVLYIMGTARSGSTVLEILLAHGEHCVGVGELTSIVQDGFIEQKSCSCGSTFDACEFWGEVVHRMGLSSEEMKDWARVQHKIEWHGGFLRQLVGLVSRRDWELYQKFNLRLLQTIHDISNGAVIVDSSKYAGRALALSRIEEIELSVICLTRSPEGLMDSFQKPNKEEQHPKKPWSVFRYYAFVIFSLRIALFRLKGNAYPLKYETLVSHPEIAIGEIGEVCNVRLDDVVARIKSKDEFRIGHLVTGNRLRKSKQVRLVKKIESSMKTNISLQLPITAMNILKFVIWR